MAYFQGAYLPLHILARIVLETREDENVAVLGLINVCFGAENPMIVFTPDGKIFKGFLFKNEIQGRVVLDYSKLREQVRGWKPAP